MPIRMRTKRNTPTLPAMPTESQQGRKQNSTQVNPEVDGKRAHTPSDPSRTTSANESMA